MTGLVRRHDWAGTPLGEPDGWSPALRSTVDTVLAHGFAMALLWGPELLQIYNDGFRDLLGAGHPSTLGQPMAAGWPELWQAVQPFHDRLWSGETLTLEDRLLPVVRDDMPADAWFTLSYSPVRDGGQVAGVLVTLFETTAHHLEATRRQIAEGEIDDRARSEERLRQFGEASQDVLWIREVETLQWQYLTPGFETVYGLTRDDVLQGDNYRAWLDLVVPEDRELAALALERVKEGEHLTFEYRIRRPADGAIRWLRNTDFPIRAADGVITMIGGISEDVTEEKERQERLERSEERLLGAVEVGRVGLWDWNVATGEIHWSDEHFRMEGYEVGEVTPSYETWSSRLHPDDREATQNALRHALETHQEYAREFRVVHPDGAVHWLYGRGRFFYDADGNPLRMVGAMVDTTERREWEERQKALVAELQHRTRNLIAVVRSMADKTAGASRDLADFRLRFRDRLDALGRIQGLLSRLNEYDRVTFDELIRTELSAMDGNTDRVRLDGPLGVRLRSSSVQTLAMAVHELATNATKYGALCQPGATLTITWRYEPARNADKPWLHIDWCERGVAMPPPGTAPAGTGEGRELIEQVLPYQLGAQTSFMLGQDGVHCTISIPVSAN